MLCFLPSFAMYKDNAVANVVAETGTERLSLQHDWAIFQCRWKVRLNRSTLTWTVCTAADKSGKFVRRAYSRRALESWMETLHGATITRVVLVGTPVGCLLAYNSG